MFTCILYLEPYKFFSSQKLMFLSCVASIFSIYQSFKNSFEFFKIYFCLCWVFIAVHGFSLVVCGGYPLAVEHRL